ncbi:MAG: pyridoxal-phosphate dependent enzyme [Aliishimia sp.]
MLKNPFRGKGLRHPTLSDMPWPSDDARAPLALLAHCPAASATPLVHSEELAKHAGCVEFWIKDERPRMGLGSFKALGAAYAIAAEAPRDVPFETALEGRVFVTASAGNHGLSVAAGAHVFGARAVIYLAQSVPEAFADLLRSKGADVVRAGAIYEESMQAAQDAAAENGWTLLSDSSWDGYSVPAHAVMQGYTVLAAEICEAMQAAPTHVFLQAGVGGLAAAAAAYMRRAWGQEVQIIVVEPDAAPALHHSIAEGAPLDTQGPVSEMGRLDCKTPSLIALKGLARDADGFVLVSDQAVADVLPVMADAGFETSASGGAGLAASLTGIVPVPSDARVLCILSEGAV